MATGNFEKCLKIILNHEGGYVNHPKDPGGETNLGVTKRVWEQWGGTKDMTDLTVDDVSPLYEKSYWNRIKGDDLPSGLDLVVFDWAVNSGVRRASKKLQEMIGASADGVIGPNTLKQLDEYIKTSRGIKPVIRMYSATRQDFYESLSTFDTFGRGWTRRNNETKEIALEVMT